MKTKESQRERTTLSQPNTLSAHRLDLVSFGGHSRAISRKVSSSVPSVMVPQYVFSVL